MSAGFDDGCASFGIFDPHEGSLRNAGARSFADELRARLTSIEQKLDTVMTRANVQSRKSALRSDSKASLASPGEKSEREVRFGSSPPPQAEELPLRAAGEARRPTLTFITPPVDGKVPLADGSPPPMWYRRDACQLMTTAPLSPSSLEDIQDSPRHPSAAVDEASTASTCVASSRPRCERKVLERADTIESPTGVERASSCLSRGVSSRHLRDSGSVSKRLSWDTSEPESWGRRMIRRYGMSAILTGIQTAVDDARKTKGWKLVHGAHFQLMASLIIVLQGILVGYGASNAMDVAAYGGAPSEVLNLFEIFFACFFALELLMRLYFERIGFIFGPEWKWNLFDSSLVILSLVDIGLNGTDSGGMASAAVGRILRLSRFFMLMRISRVMRKLPSLRLILLAILNSMVSLVWCFLFIAFIMYVFAVMFVYGAAEHFSYFAADLDDAMDVALLTWWGSIYRSMVTLFMCIAGGVDWYQVLEPLTAMGWAYEPLFCFYIFFMCFGVLNVVVGAFVATTGEIAEKDRETLVTCAIKELDGYTNKIKGFFREADLDNSGTLSWEEFSKHLEDPKVKAYFQALQLDVSQAHILFDLLDVDGSDSVTVDEFIDGCIRLRGAARSIDLNMLVFVCQRTFNQLGEYMSNNEQIMRHLKESLPQLREEDVDD